MESTVYLDVVRYQTDQDGGGGLRPGPFLPSIRGGGPVAMPAVSCCV